MSPEHADVENDMMTSYTFLVKIQKVRNLQLWLRVYWVGKTGKSQKVLCIPATSVALERKKKPCHKWINKYVSA